METTIFTVIVLIVSVVIHEVAHGWVALWFGDRTAERAGRLTLNPVPHLDLFGSILLPGILILTQAGMYFGWAKPVPYNPNNLRGGRWAELAVASAGILTNLLIGFIFSSIAAVAFVAGNEAFAQGAGLIGIINLYLGFFNLLPIPPFDGFKILSSAAPTGLFLKIRDLEARMRGFEMLILIAVLYIFSSTLSPVFGEWVRGVQGLIISIWL